MSDSGLSKELSAMVGLEKALGDLSDDERQRVLAWASSRFNVPLASNRKTPGSEQVQQENDTPPAAQQQEASTIEEFYDKAGPTTDAEKALVVAYWFQVNDGILDLDSQSVNSQLKHLGHGIGNVTRAFDVLKAQKPALMVQKRKEGTSQQARKKFMVTNEGKKFVEKMLAKTI